MSRQVRKWFAAAVLLISCACGSFCPGLQPVLAVQASDAAHGKFRSLFDGKSLSHWRVVPPPIPDRANSASASASASTGQSVERPTSGTDATARGPDWSISPATPVTGSAIQNGGSGGCLVSNAQYSDFELEFEFRSVRDAVLVIKGGRLLLPAGSSKTTTSPHAQWTKAIVRVTGARVSVWIDGKEIAPCAILSPQAPDERHQSGGLPAVLMVAGHVQICPNGAPFSFRHPRIRELSPEESNKHLADRVGSGYRRIFDGNSLAGWDGAKGGYEIIDGTLRCKPGHGGTIFTQRTWSDFSMRFEFRLPPGGNNGLAIRYPGSGDTAYVGMCELQILDDTAKQFTGLDARQYHGSIYGIAAAVRGRLRPPGEWNFQEVTVTGTSIVVELNGFVILDADVKPFLQLDSNEPFLDGKAHPGLSRTDGHLGFAGHGSAVEFREIFVREE